MKDYRITVRVRNNRILKAIEKSGGTPGGKWCADNGLSYTMVNDLINMTASPLSTSGALRDVAQRLCDTVNCLPEDLWSNEQLYPLETNMSSIEMDSVEVSALLDYRQATYLPDETSGELTKHIDFALATLRQREEIVLRMRFHEDMSYEQIGKRFDLSIERIRQIEALALRKLRHQSISSVLGQHLDGDAGDECAKIYKERKIKYESVLI